MRELRESDVLRACLDFLTLKGVWHFRANQVPVPLPGGGFRRFVGKKGVPDILCVLGPLGTLYGVEVKRPGGRVSPDQRRVHEELDGLGAFVSVVTSVEELERDLAEVMLHCATRAS